MHLTHRLPQWKSVGFLYVLALFASLNMMRCGLGEDVLVFPQNPSVAATNWPTNSPAMGIQSDDWEMPIRPAAVGAYQLEFLPKDSLYPFYLADMKASRLSSIIEHGKYDNSIWDVSLGGRFGLIRYVNDDPEWKRGWQVDVEGAGLVRLDFDHERDVRSADFRAGMPITLSFGRLQTRFGYYHLSSHLGDEFLLKNPGFPRLNYSRDVLFVGAAYWLTRSTRVYGEAGWAFYSDVSEPWEFQFGIEGAPRGPTGPLGAPFYAIGGQFREELNYGGALTAQVGWAWRAWQHTGLLRTGLHYYNGKSSQFSFYNHFEEFLGWGVWYDF